jgi:hypothetical protein
MFGWLFKCVKSPPPPLDQQVVQRLRCPDCGGDFEPWDGVIGKALWRDYPPYGRVYGTVVRFCLPCNTGHEFYWVEKGLAPVSKSLKLDYIPKPEHLDHQVPLEALREDWADRAAWPPYRSFLNLICEGDEIWWFMSDPESWARLAGRGGYCIVRDGAIVGAIIIVLN